MSKSDPRLDPPLSMPTYAVRAPLVRWLAEEAERAAATLGPYRLLDVGCGEMPYLPLFEPHAREVVGMDTPDNPRATLTGTIEAIPAPDASFDVVLCAQVLEHVNDPAQGVRELNRVTRPGGRVLLSTHGTMVYHPNPDDLWRWTGPGLERLFRENGDWDSVTVSAGAGTASSLAMLNAIYLEHVLRRTPLRSARGVVVAALNRVARLIDRRFRALADERPGTFAANYHVVAVRAFERGGTPGSPTSPLLLRSDATTGERASRPAKPASGRETEPPGRSPEPTDSAPRNPTPAE